MAADSVQSKKPLERTAALPQRYRDMISGVQFLVDEEGHQRSVMIDLSVHGELWEDFYDCYCTQIHTDKPTRPWQEVKQELGLDSP